MAVREALLALLGMGPAYVMIACFYLASLGLTLCITRPPRASPADPPASPWREVREGLAYVAATPRMLAAMVIAFLVNFCAFPLSGGLLPYVARDIYGMGQTGLGLLAAGFASGGLVGSLMLSTVARNIPAGRIMICFTSAGTQCCCCIRMPRCRRWAFRCWCWPGSCRA